VGTQQAILERPGGPGRLGRAPHDAEKAAFVMKQIGLDRSHLAAFNKRFGVMVR
jgi:hypothetical protein